VNKLPLFAKSHGKSGEEIRRRILQAIFDQRMPPGARVTEEQLAAAFDVSRTVIRQAMAQLSQDGVLVKLPNIGATIASPSVKETRDILAVRRMVEPGIVKLIASNPEQAQLDRLRRHIEQEKRAQDLNDRPTLIRLSGEFHLLLAEVAGNGPLIRLMTGLQALTCLAVLLYADGDEACLPHEHSRIIDAIARNDGEAAAVEMIHHLIHAENELRLDRVPGSASVNDTMKWLRGQPGS